LRTQESARRPTHRCDRELEPVRRRHAEPLLQRIEPLPQSPEQLDIVTRLRIVLRVLKVDVEPVEAVVCDERDGALDEAGAACRGRDRAGEAAVLGVGPAADREEDLERAVALFEEVQLLEVAVQVGPARVVPRVGPVVDLRSE